LPRRRTRADPMSGAARTFIGSMDLFIIGLTRFQGAQRPGEPSPSLDSSCRFEAAAAG
jgi:hypothetical protein